MMKKSLLFLFLILGGCATKQAVRPIDTNTQVVPQFKLPAPAILAPPVTEVPEVATQSITPPVSKDTFNEEYVRGHGQEVEVITDPAGARIMLNGEPLGVAPGKFHIIRKPNRYGFLPRMTITAIPAEGAQDQYSQTKIFDGYTDTPEKIYFDMSSPPPLPRLEDGY